MKISEFYKVTGAIGIVVCVATACNNGGGNGTGGDATYGLTASVSGLGASTVTLEVNGIEGDVTGDSQQSITTGLTDGAAYAVSVAVQPDGLYCKVVNGVGVVDGADIDDVAVTCSSQVAFSLAADGSVEANSSGYYGTIDAFSGTATLDLNTGELSYDYSGAVTIIYTSAHQLFYQITTAESGVIGGNWTSPVLDPFDNGNTNFIDACANQTGTLCSGLTTNLANSVVGTIDFALFQDATTTYLTSQPRSDGTTTHISFVLTAQ